MQQFLSVLQRPGKIILYLLFTILAIITALLCVLDRLYHAWILSFLSGIIFLYCVQASATITSIVAICSCVCSIDWCFPCNKVKSLRRTYNHSHHHHHSRSGTSSSAVVTFLCHQRNGSSSAGSSVQNSTQHFARKSTTVTTSSGLDYKTSITDENGEEAEEECRVTISAEEILNVDLTRPATSYNNPCYILAVSTTDENGIPAILKEKDGDGESVTQV